MYTCIAPDLMHVYYLKYTFLLFVGQAFFGCGSIKENTWMCVYVCVCVHSCIDCVEEWNSAVYCSMSYSS